MFEDGNLRETRATSWCLAASCSLAAMRRHSLELQSSEWQSEPPMPETSRSDHSSRYRAALSSSLFWYLVQLTPARLALWSYLIWYLVVLVRHFEAAWTLWLN